jgi:hypothetical protein
MKILTAVGVTVMLATFLAGCSSKSTGPSAAPTSREPGMGVMMGDRCPMKVPGTTVASVDVDGGASLVFVTMGDVPELRDRVRAMAEMHNRRQAGGGMMMGNKGPGEAGGSQGLTAGETMPAATASADDVEGGARLVLVPTDPAQLKSLRAHTRMHADRMTRGECGPAPSSAMK